MPARGVAAGRFCLHASETLALPARATLGTRASRPPFRMREKKPTPLSSHAVGEGLGVRAKSRRTLPAGGTEQGRSGAVINHRVAGWYLKVCERLCDFGGT